MSTSKRIPERMCVVCRTMHPKTQLIRLVLIDNVITIDDTQKLPGRGVWVEKTQECVTNLKKRKVLNRIFKREVDDTFYQKLEDYLNG